MATITDPFSPEELAIPDPLATSSAATDAPEINLSSIPQSSAPPAIFTGIYGKDPAIEQEAQYQETVTKWRSDSQNKLDAAVLDPDAYFKDKDLSFDPDPKRARSRVLTDAALSFLNDGAPLPPDDLSRKLMRQETAILNFGGEGSDSDEAFLAAYHKSATQRKNTKELSNNIAIESRKSALITALEPDSGKAITFTQWREANKSKITSADQDADLLEQWNAERETVRDALYRFKPELNRVWSTMNGGGAGSPSEVIKAYGADAVSGHPSVAINAARELAKMDAGATAFEIFQNLAPEDRDDFMVSLGVLARTMPAEMQASFWANLNMIGGRAVDDLIRNVGLGAERVSRGGPRPPVFGPGGQATADISDKTAERWNKANDEFLARRDFVDAVRAIERNDFAPTPPLAKQGTFLRVLEEGAYMVPGALASTGMAVTPVVGSTLMFLSTESSLYGTLRDNFRASKMPAKEASQAADALAPITAIPVAALEKVQAAAWLGRMPFLEGAMTSLGNKIVSGGVRFAFRTTVGAAEQTATEMAQDLLPYVVQEVGSAVSKDMPGVNFTGQGGVLQGLWTQSASTFVGMLPLALLTGVGGFSNDRRLKALSDHSDTQLLAIGFSPDRVARFREAQGEGLASMRAAAESMLETRDSNSDTARTAVEQLVTQSQRQQAATAVLQSSGILPRFVQTPAGWSVRDTITGEEIGTATTSQDAIRIATAHTDSITENDAERVAYLATMLEAGDFTKASDSETRTTTTDFRPGERLTTTQAAAESLSNAQRIAAQTAAREIAEGGDGSMTELVFGQSITDPDKLAKGLRHTTNRLQEGASILTVFHEETHGFYREAIATGRLSTPGTLTILRAVDTVLAARPSRDGKSITLLPVNFDGLPADQQAAAIDEAVSELLEAEILRTRKGGGVRQLPPGLVSRNLAAIARLAGEAETSKFRSFINAIRAFFGIALDRAATIKQALADGTLDADSYTGFLSNLYGLSEQTDFEQAARDAEASILEGLTDTETETAGDPFSLGNAAIADALRGDALSRIKSPERRIEAMARIARALESSRLQAERLELLAGSKRLRKSLTKEAAFREAARAEELEREAYARHWGILSVDDLTKIKSQPGHAFLADPNSHLHGRLMSKSAAIKKHPDMFQIHRPGDYDGSDGVSRSLFGGKLMPDQAAQEMYDAGLIKHPTPDAMWEMLLKEQAMVSSMKENLAKAQEDIRNARQQAKKETNEWLATQTQSQVDNYSPKQEIIRALAMLDAILGAVPAEIRGKIGGYTQLARITTDEAKLSFLKDRLNKVDKEIETWLKAQFGREMEALLKRAKPHKADAGEKPRGTIGSDVHALMRSMEEAMGLTAPQAEARLRTLLTDAEAAWNKQNPSHPADSPTESEDVQAMITRLGRKGVLDSNEESHFTQLANFIPLVADWHHADAARRESAVKEATRILEEGYFQHLAEMSAKRERRNKQRFALKAATGKAGGRMERVTRAKKDAKKIGRNLQSLLSLASYEQVVHTAFGEGTPEAETLIEWERHASNAKEDAIQGKLDAIERLFADLAGGKYKGEQLRYKMGTEDAVSVKLWNGEIETFTELEAIAATLMWRQEDGKRHMEGHVNDAGTPVGEWHWRQQDMDSIESQLSTNAKALRLFLGTEYAAEYDRLNPVFRSLYGVDLPRHKHYSPLTVKPVQTQAGQVLDPVTGSGMSGVSLTPGSLRNRAQVGAAEPDFRDALQTFIAHTRQMEHWMAYAPMATEAMALINAREVGNAVEAAGGKETINVLRSWLDFFAQGGNRDASAHLTFVKSLGRKVNRVASAALVGRVSVLGIQSLQLGAGLAQMPTGAYVTRMARLFNPLDGFAMWREAKKSNFIERRRNQMPPLVRQALDGLMASRPNRLKYWISRLGETISGADALFTAGTYAIIYDYQLKQAKATGMTGTEAETWARDAAERSTERVAQPTRAGTRSLYEVNATNPTARLMWAFASDARQKLALTAYALKNKPLSEKMRTLTVTWIIGGMGAALFRAMMRDIRDDEDKEVFDERNWDPLVLGLASVTGPLQGIPVLGETIEAGLYKAFGKYLPSGQLFSMEGSIGRLKNVPDWISGDRDFNDIMKDLDAIMSGGAPFSDTVSAASSAMHLISDTVNILDNFFGD